MGTAAAAPPLVLGRYALYEKLASGGMASVHIGRLVGPVGFARTVAIKRMHPQFAEDPEFVSMFLDEARLAARIRHPNVVPTLDVVATAGELFLVMDFVQGESLARLIRTSTLGGQRIAPAMAASIMAGVLHGLHAAHEAKNERGEPLEIVHRDVSPHNILVGVDGVSRVLDFGVAKAVGRLQTTREGQLKGKLAYMAPEQLRGHVSRATDVYAASVVLWEALTCQRLFQAENEGHMFDVVLKGCTEPPSARAPDVPPLLDAVTMRGLAVDPEKRFRTAREMAVALEEALTPAAASRIGDWVERSAKETLDQRSARIATIESDSSTYAPSAWAPDPSSQPSLASSSVGQLRRVATSDDAAIPVDTGLTQLSSGSVSAPGPMRSSARRPWVTWVAAVGLLLLGGGIVAIAKSGGGRQTSAATTGATSPPSAGSEAAPSPTAPAPPLAPPTGSPEPPMASAEVALAAIPSSKPLAKNAGRVGAGTTPSTVAAPPKGKGSCNPNYTFDSEGNKIFKPECFGH
jgi:eukaryotic-like serine/threonine-protein kinase